MIYDIISNSKTVIWSGPVGYYEKKPSYLSTGGGAFLHWLEKFTLPGIEALKK